MRVNVRGLSVQYAEEQRHCTVMLPENNGFVQSDARLRRGAGQKSRQRCEDKQHERMRHGALSSTERPSEVLIVPIEHCGALMARSGRLRWSRYRMEASSRSMYTHTNNRAAY